jgi:hypothetical protein
VSDSLTYTLTRMIAALEGYLSDFYRQQPFIPEVENLVDQLVLLRRRVDPEHYKPLDERG